MERYNRGAGAASAPTPPSAPANPYFTEGNPSLGVPATQPGPWWYHMVTEELRKVITDAGLTPDHTDLTQLSAAIQAMIAAIPPDGYNPGDIFYHAGQTAPAGSLKLNGAGILVASYSALTAAVYCGDANNATADSFYRADNSDGSSRNIAGAYLILADARGEFFRSWDDGRGVDSGRVLGGWQKGSLAALDVNVIGTASIYSNVATPSSARALLGYDEYTTSDYSGARASAGNSVVDYALPGGTEVTTGTGRPRNIALLACIKY